MTKELIQYIKENLLIGQSDIELLPEDDLLGSGLVDSIENFMTVEAISNYLQEQKV